MKIKLVGIVLIGLFSGDNGVNGLLRGSAPKSEHPHQHQHPSSETRKSLLLSTPSRALTQAAMHQAQGGIEDPVAVADDVPADYHCGCFSCTNEIWESNAEGFTCGSRIQWLELALPWLFHNEEHACIQVANVEFPNGPCGPACDPTMCNLDYGPPAAESSNSASPPVYSYRCGCPECNQEALDAMADTFTCGARIAWVMGSQGVTEEHACHVVSSQFPNICGSKCDPHHCEKSPLTPPPTPVTQEGSPPSPPVFEPRCGCPSCTEEFWDMDANGYSCGDRILWVMGNKSMTEEDACIQVSFHEFFDGPCGPHCDPTRCHALNVLPEPTTRPSVEPSVSMTPTTSYCGCNDCTQTWWDTVADGATCGDRITWVIETLNKTEEEACIQVAGQEYTCHCGPACDPQKCDGQTVPVVTPAPSPTPKDPLTPETDLYCFPPYGGRVRHEGIWGDFIVEVKEGPDPCGPGDNRFSKEVVSVESNKVTLEYKQVDGVWSASEVRLLLPDEKMPFTYGKFGFSVPSIEVLDIDSTTVISNLLPKNMILGLFTWDSIDDFATHENYNHEVDVEISRWDVEDGPDMQFLVQPPGCIQHHKFYSGSNGTGYDQSGHTYSFDWTPGGVEWSSTAGGNEAFQYTTEMTILSSVPDYVQCLPANVEIRMNLWELNGGSPDGLVDGQSIKVVIDDFSFVPFPVAYVDDGEYCSKHCQCQPTSLCVDTKCTQQ